ELRRGREVVGHVRERADLAAHRLHEGRMRVPERVHRDTRQEVEVLVSVHIPDAGALAADQHPLRRRQCPHDRVAERLAPGASAPIFESSESRLGQSLYSPATSVRVTSLDAPSATARAAAAASALTLSACPASSMSGAMDDTTGMRPAASCVSTASGSTATTSPTSPRS